MASLWIRSGEWLAIEGNGSVSPEAHFEALIEGVLMAPLKTIDTFFSYFEVPCRTVFLTASSVTLPCFWQPDWSFAELVDKFSPEVPKRTEKDQPRASGRKRKEVDYKDYSESSGAELSMLHQAAKRPKLTHPQVPR